MSTLAAVKDSATPPYPKHLRMVVGLVRVAAQPCLSFEERLEALTDAACVLRLIDPEEACLIWGTIDYGKTNDYEYYEGYGFLFDQLRRMVAEEEAVR